MRELALEELLNAELYNGEEWDWVELHKLAGGLSATRAEMSVEQAARYLNAHPEYSTGLVRKIRELEGRFRFSEHFVDACPSRSGGGIYLRNGNKRSIAYAMRLLRGIETFQPVPVRDWQPDYTELDWENLQGLPTTNDPVK